MAILGFKKCILFGLDVFSDMLRAMTFHWALCIVLKGGSTFFPMSLLHWLIICAVIK